MDSIIFFSFLTVQLSFDHWKYNVSHICISDFLVAALTSVSVKKNSYSLEVGSYVLPGGNF